MTALPSIPVAPPLSYNIARLSIASAVSVVERRGLRPGGKEFGSRVIESHGIGAKSYAAYRTAKYIGAYEP